MDEFSRSATDEEKQLAIDNFASGLLNEFGGYFCDSFLVIAYWENETLVSLTFACIVNIHLFHAAYW